MQDNNSNLNRNTMTEELQEASLSFAVVVIPEHPLRAQLATASVAIDHRFKSRNIVDDEMYPPHLSLYMGGTDLEFVEDLRKRLHAEIQSHVSATLVAEHLYHESGGFIAVACAQDYTLLSLTGSVIDVCGHFHRKKPRYRPRILARWSQLPVMQKELVKAYGTEKVPPNWQPHLSIADVDEKHVRAALQIAEAHLSLPQPFSIAAIELVNVGANNEQWQVLERWSAK
jgi:hypothetical protein